MRKKLYVVLAAAALMMQAGCGNQNGTSAAAAQTAPAAETEAAGGAIETQEPETSEPDWDEILATLSEAVAKVEAAVEQSTGTTLKGSKEKASASQVEKEETEAADSESADDAEEIEESAAVRPAPLSGTTISYSADSAELTAPVLLEPAVRIPEGYTTVSWYLDSLHTIPVTFPYAISDHIRESGIDLFPVYGN